MSKRRLCLQYRNLYCNCLYIHIGAYKLSSAVTEYGNPHYNNRVSHIGTHIVICNCQYCSAGTRSEHVLMHYGKLNIILIMTSCAVFFMHRHITAFFATSHTPVSGACSTGCRT